MNQKLALEKWGMNLQDNDPLFSRKNGHLGTFFLEKNPKCNWLFILIRTLKLPKIISFESVSNFSQEQPSYLTCCEPGLFYDIWRQFCSLFLNANSKQSNNQMSPFKLNGARRRWFEIEENMFLSVTWTHLL